MRRCERGGACEAIRQHNTSSTVIRAVARSKPRHRSMIMAAAAPGRSPPHGCLPDGDYGFPIDAEQRGAHAARDHIRQAVALWDCPLNPGRQADASPSLSLLTRAMCRWQYDIHMSQTDNPIGFKPVGRGIAPTFCSSVSNLNGFEITEQTCRPSPLIILIISLST